MTQHSFKTVSSQLLLLGLIAEYLQFLDIIPSLAVEIAHRVVELVKVSQNPEAETLQLISNLLLTVNQQLCCICNASGKCSCRIRIL